MMLMANLFRLVALVAVVQIGSGAYTCPNGWKDKDGTPTCAGAMSSTCSATTCCDPQPTCATFQVAWLASQFLNAGCAADTKFFDLKKVSAEVADPAGDDEVKAACCTPFADAQCSDWAAVLGSCPSGKAFVGTNSAAPDGSDGKTLSQSKYQEMCCIEEPQTCSDFTLGWAAAQLLGTGCAADTQFFDLKKASAEVADPAGDDQVKASCCTPFADAQCSDWAATKSCASGTFIVNTNSAAPDGSDGKTLSQAKFRELCCETPMKCEDYIYASDVSSSKSQAAASVVVSLSAIAAMVVA